MKRDPLIRIGQGTSQVDVDDISWRDLLLLLAVVVAACIMAGMATLLT